MIEKRIGQLLEVLNLNAEEEESLIEYLDEAEDFIDLHNAGITLLEALEPEYNSELFHILMSFLWGSREMIQDFIRLFMEELSLDEAIQILTNVSLALKVEPDGRIDDSELIALSDHLEGFLDHLEGLDN